MSNLRNPTRQRVIQAAAQLFAAQGVTDTTTKQIAELAEVNEVTLFRQFGNKYGLLLAVIEETTVFSQLGDRFVKAMNDPTRLDQAVQNYANTCLQKLEQMPELVRSLVGEAGQYPLENRKALGYGFTQTNSSVAKVFAAVIDREPLHANLSAETLVSLLNSLLLGYAVIELTSESHGLWLSRDEFLSHLTTLVLHGAVSDAEMPEDRSAPLAVSSTGKVADLPAKLVHSILQQARKRSLQDYALVYVLFAAGLSPSEIVHLDRSHHISDRDQHLLQVNQGGARQVPVNQWVMAKRYGSYLKNPLTQWLKSRKDSHAALFLNAEGEPLTEANIRQQWQDLINDLVASSNGEITLMPAIEQTQQTWCVEMLMRGMSLEDMQLLTGMQVHQLKPYAQRAREKAALEQAIRLDQKS